MEYVSLFWSNQISKTREIRLSKDEKDRAKRLEKFRNDLEHSDRLAFNGEPISEGAKESLIESMEYIFRKT